MTDLSLSAMPLVAPLKIATPHLSYYFLFNLLCCIGCGYYFARRIISDNLIIGRLSFCLPVLIFVFYQFPLVIFSRQINEGLQNPWVYSLVVNGAIGVLIAYGVLSRGLDFHCSEIQAPKGVSRIYAVALILAIVTLAIYLRSVPFRCTGLYAILFDPWLTLMAREFGVKLIGTSLATYAWGAYANTIAPTLVLISLLMIKTSRGIWRAASILLGVLTGFAAVVTVLISGTKGLLIPLLIMLLSGAYFWSSGWRTRLITMLLSTAFVFSSMIGFEVFRERSSVIGAKYDFAACSAATGTCQKSLEMLDSMQQRDNSLGMPSAYVKPIHERLTCLCNGSGDVSTCPSGTLSVITPKKITEIVEKEEIGEKEGIEKREGVEKKEGSQFMIEWNPEIIRGAFVRSLSYGEAIFNRLFVVPFQVSTWSFMYAESEDFDGLKTLPFARRTFGESLNMPELVYQKYGAIYSNGDRTSTSTAPTSFILSYPAFLGVKGFLLAIVCIICLDLLLARLAVFAGEIFLPYVVGVVLVLSVNFMSSDFVTVLLSHGGVAGVILIIFLGLLDRRLK